MNILKILIPTLFFILYTPNLIFKPLVKNKFYNTSLFALFFGFSVYIFNHFFVQKENLENFKESIQTPANQRFVGEDANCIASQKYSDTDSDIVKKLKTNIIDNNNLTANEKKILVDSYTKEKNSIVSNAQKYSKDVCAKKAQWTTPPADYINSFQNRIYDSGRITQKPTVYVKTPTVSVKTPTVSVKTPTVSVKTPTVSVKTPTVSVKNSNSK